MFTHMIIHWIASHKPAEVNLEALDETKLYYILASSHKPAVANLEASWWYQTRLHISTALKISGYVPTSLDTTGIYRCKTKCQLIIPMYIFIYYVNYWEYLSEFDTVLF